MIRPDIVRVPYDSSISLELERTGMSYIIWACSDTVIEDVVDLVLQQEKLPEVIHGWFS